MLFQTPTKYGSDRFRQIFIDHWQKWWDYRREEIPADQRAYVQKTVEKMMGCRNPQCGYARYRRTIFFPGIVALRGGEGVSTRVNSSFNLLPISINISNNKVGIFPYPTKMVYFKNSSRVRMTLRHQINESYSFSVLD
jgi:hypothetical protein